MRSGTRCWLHKEKQSLSPNAGQLCRFESMVCLSLYELTTKGRHTLLLSRRITVTGKKSLYWRIHSGRPESLCQCKPTWADLKNEDVKKIRLYAKRVISAMQNGFDRSSVRNFKRHGKRSRDELLKTRLEVQFTENVFDAECKYVILFSASPMVKTNREMNMD